MISIELNELNVDWIKHYISNGELKNFKKLFDDYQIIETTSESRYEELEPWIQWPSFYSGKSFAEHKCFHIGDFYMNKPRTIYDDFQEKGKSVLAISPMNCFFDEKSNSFFLPDPWEEFESKNKGFISKVYKSIAKKVNTNAAGSVNIRDYLLIFFGIIAYARPKNYFSYLSLASKSLKHKWCQAIFLDLLLSDIFIAEYKKTNYAYASIFLNAGAHIQHHHLYDSDCYSGANRNPSSYSSASKSVIDPILEVLKQYDCIIKDIIDLDNNFLISTGLQQIENKNPYFQYRFNDFDKFLSIAGLEIDEITPRMSRDFTIVCNDASYDKNIKILDSFKIKDQKLFSLDCNDKEQTIFAKIAWNGEINSFNEIYFKDEILDFTNLVSLVSIENAIHCSKGWHLNNFLDIDSPSLNIWDFRNKIISTI